jgi:hypothetical protein
MTTGKATGTYETRLSFSEPLFLGDSWTYIFLGSTISATEAEHES